MQLIDYQIKEKLEIYISLKRRAHHGKSPPCVDKIISSNIKRVVYSINDVDLERQENLIIYLNRIIFMLKKFYLSLTKKLYKELFLF